MNFSPTLDQKTLDFIQWLVPEENANIVQLITAGFSKREKKAAFDEAERDQTILVFDEVDTLLYSRNMAQQSWEVGCVNEFLNALGPLLGEVGGSDHP